MQLLLRSVKIIDPQSPHHLSICDIRLRDGIINTIGEALAVEDEEEVMDCEGLCISAGWIDLLASSGDPGEEYREDIISLSEAALKGGFTGLGYLPVTKPAIQTKADIQYILNKSSVTPVNFYPLGAITADRKGEIFTEMYDMRNAGAMAFTDADLPVKDAGIMLRALQYVRQFEGTIINVPSDYSIVGNATVNEGAMSMQLGMYGIPAVLEEIMVERDIQLARYTNSKVHIASVSTAGAINRIREAKSEGLKVTASVTPYHLFFEESAVGDYHTNFKVNPPLRTLKDQTSLKEGLADRTIDTITSFHLPYEKDSKLCEFEYASFGMAGIETAFSVANSVLSEHIELTTLIDTFTLAPRNILGLESKAIKEGVEMDLTIFDPLCEWEVSSSDLKSRGVNNAFIGQNLTGKAICTITKKRLNKI